MDMAKENLIVMTGLVVAVMCSYRAVSLAEEAGAHPGVIRGIVTDAETCEAIAGAYVGVGEFGDSGGSNRSRHMKEGLFAKGQTDSEGKFELDGLVLTEGHKYLKSHPLVVTHDNYVRADMKVELSTDRTEADVKVNLTKAARIDVTVVDSSDEPMEGYWILRLEDLNGRRFIPPGQDPHMSTFSSSVWTKNPDLRARENMGRSTGFSFHALKAGEYRVEAIRLNMLPIPSPVAIWEQPWRYHGQVSKVTIKTGELRAVVIAPENNGTSLTIRTPAEPFAGLSKLEETAEDSLKDLQIRGVLKMSRNPRLTVWDMGRVYHVEDDRLGRIQREAMFCTMVTPGESFTIENLAPGRYAVLSMANVKVVVAISSAAIEVVAGQDGEVDMPVPVIEGPGEVGVHAMARRVELADRGYTVKELCQIVSTATGSSPELVADPAIENEVVRIGGGEIVMWDLVERLCAQKRLKLKEMGSKKLGIGN
jgi:hypothetical protein